MTDVADKNLGGDGDEPGADAIDVRRPRPSQALEGDTTLPATAGRGRHA